MSVKTFENNGKSSISWNIVKSKLDQKIKSLLNNHLVFICVEETDFWQLYDTSAGSEWKITSTQFTVKDHNWVSLTYGDFASNLVL